MRLPFPPAEPTSELGAAGGADAEASDSAGAGELAARTAAESFLAPAAEADPFAATGAGAAAGFAAAAGASDFAGAAAVAAPAASITATTVWIGTVWPSFTLISFSTPAAGAGISASTLSVEISKSGSSRSTLSPGFFNHLVMVPSKILSPIWGMMTSVREAGAASAVGAGDLLLLGASTFAGAGAAGVATAAAGLPSASPM